MAKAKKNKTKKYKLKSHSGVSKKIKARKNDFKIGKVGSRHFTGKKSASFNRGTRKGSTLDSGDLKRYKNLVK